MTDWSMMIAECFDAPPYQLPPVRLIKGEYELHILLWGREFHMVHPHLNVVMGEYVTWTRALQNELKQAEILDLTKKAGGQP